MKISLLLAWLQANRMTTDWQIADGRRFQLSGNPQISGCWERFFPVPPGTPFDPNVESNFPYRKAVTGDAAQAAFDAGAEFLLYTTMWDDGETVTRDELLSRVQNWLSQK